MPDMDRDTIARGVIEEALQLNVFECEAALTEARKKLKDAHDQLRKARREFPMELKAWRMEGRLDPLVGLRALMIAQIKDFAETSRPGGRHIEAVRSYLAEHHPPVGVGTSAGGPAETTADGE